MQTSELAALACEEGDFDNFTYVNENNFSEIEAASNGQVRPQTELLNLRSSFARPGAASSCSNDSEDKQKQGQHHQ